jgi:hypothetical protein
VFRRVQNETAEWQHEHEVTGFPWPVCMRTLERECEALGPDEGPGRLGTAWLTRVRVWADRLQSSYQLGDGTVTGGWSRAVKLWRSRLGHLSAGQRELLLQRIEHGERLPFE